MYVGYIFALDDIRWFSDLLPIVLIFVLFVLCDIFRTGSMGIIHRVRTYGICTYLKYIGYRVGLREYFDMSLLIML